MLLRRVVHALEVLKEVFVVGSGSFGELIKTWEQSSVVIISYEITEVVVGILGIYLCEH
jgi:hypothetical protein